ncbi:MAG: M48 family metallopeptidase [Myxococcales bacterium]|nr:M48 family metallopeptidase [Myxococcales bacterium]HRC54376.1 M48 family metallopeptidase [Kofleriaceae bacterium]
MTAGVDFDFARWIASRRSSMDQQAREGIAYAYTGEQKFRRTLAAARPVTIAIEATTRLWRDVARAELLGSAVKVSSQQFPRVYQAARTAGANLRVTVPTVFAAASPAIKVKALGTDDAPYLVVNLELAETLSDTELVAAIGHELGHIQNGHILYATALHYLSNSAAFFVRWVVQPAIMTLQAWSRRAEVTCDRASLLAVRDVDDTLAALVKLAMGSGAQAGFSVEEYLRDLPDPKRGLGRYAELFRANPYVPKRVMALRAFADSAYYAMATGADPSGRPSAPDVDRRVADIISVF